MEKIDKNELLNKNEITKLMLTKSDNIDFWVKYISQICEIKGIAEARKIADSAILNLNFKNDKLKLDLYKIYLNLEFYFGDEDSFDNIFKQSINANNTEDVLLHCISLYKKNNDINNIERIINIFIKKGNKLKGWSLYLDLVYDKISLYKEDNVVEEESIIKDLKNEIKSIVKRATQSLKSKEHLNILTKYATNEYKFKFVESARNIFENIIHNYKNRTDLWSVYIDMELKYNNDFEYIKNLMDRSIKLKMKPKQKKFWFKKFLQLESIHGDEEGVNNIKKLAEEYVKSLINK